MDPQLKQYIDKKWEILLDLINTHRHQGYDQTLPIPTNRIALVDAATVASNFKIGSHFYCTLTANRTLGNPANAKDGQRFIFELIQDGTGSRTITLDTKFALGTTISSITLTTTASLRDFIEGHYSAADDKFYITKFVKGY